MLAVLLALPLWAFVGDQKGEYNGHILSKDFHLEYTDTQNTTHCYPIDGKTKCSNRTVFVDVPQAWSIVYEECLGRECVATTAFVSGEDWKRLVVGDFLDESVRLYHERPGATTDQ